MYAGSEDEFFKEWQFNRVEKYFTNFGSNVTSHYVSDFAHILPSNLPVDEVWHPEKSCAITDFAWPKKSAYRNCGYNLAKYLLQNLNPNATLKARALNY